MERVMSLMSAISLVIVVLASVANFASANGEFGPNIHNFSPVRYIYEGDLYMRSFASGYDDEVAGLFKYDHTEIEDFDAFVIEFEASFGTVYNLDVLGTDYVPSEEVLFDPASFTLSENTIPEDLCLPDGSGTQPILGGCAITYTVLPTGTPPFKIWVRSTDTCEACNHSDSFEYYCTDFRCEKFPLAVLPDVSAFDIGDTTVLPGTCLNEFTNSAGDLCRTSSQGTEGACDIGICSIPQFGQIICIGQVETVDCTSDIYWPYDENTSDCLPYACNTGTGICEEQGPDDVLCPDIDECNTGICLMDGSCDTEPLSGNSCLVQGQKTCQFGTCMSGTCDLVDNDNFCADISEQCGTGICSPLDTASNPITGCVISNMAANGNPCDDNIACTENDQCLNGICAGSTNSTFCDDNVPCTNDMCIPGDRNADAFGCVIDIVNANCPADQFSCTVELCTPNSPGVDINGCTIGNLPLVCADNFSCTLNECKGADSTESDPVTGCVTTLLDLACDDGLTCTDEVCDPESSNAESSGCTYTEFDVRCDDGIGCILNTCNRTNSNSEFGSGCLSEPVHSLCDDSEECTFDTCRPGFNADEQGCLHDSVTFDGNLCLDDGFSCTNDTCSNGSCDHVTIDDVCPDSECTDGICEPDTQGANLITGCIADGSGKEGATCSNDDGIDCTNATCVDSACINVPDDEFCADDTVCTVDTCNPFLSERSDGCFFEGMEFDKEPCESDNKECTNDVCCEGACTNIPENGASCEPNEPNECMVFTCDLQGTCEGQNVYDNTPCSDDGNECTFDACINGQCEHIAFSDELNKSCESDGNECTRDICISGSCANVPLNFQSCLDDLNPCTNNTCIEGSCTAIALVGLVCNADDNACTVPDQCDQLGNCVTGPDADCSDNNVCTADFCAFDKGCYYKDLSKTCDQCQKCDAIMGCVTDFLQDGFYCDDEKVCTENDKCSEGTCLGEDVDCDDGNPCTDDYCSPFPISNAYGENSSGCVHVPNTDSCDDGDACTEADQCSATVCVPGPSIKCDDGLFCTVDSCHPITGCDNNAVPMQNMMCDDSDACTNNEFCDDGFCLHGVEIICDDENQCTGNTCDSEMGCVYELLEWELCDNEDPCNGPDFCTLEGGSIHCHSGPDLDCDDSDACTVDVCEILWGGCHHEEVSCDDANQCTYDKCDSHDGCINDATPYDGDMCDDWDMCTKDDVCGDGECTGMDIICEDNDACTINECHPNDGCLFLEINCDDNNDCTEDTCDAIDGCSYASRDGHTCGTDNMCIVHSICVEDECMGDIIDCDDMNPCTKDWCDPLVGCINEDIVCDDNNDCTEDMCDANVGLCIFSHEARNGHGCDDESLCTDADTCQDGFCVGSPINCDDHNLCTVDGCNPLIGCAYGKLSNNPCNGGDECLESYCDEGVCIEVDKECDRGNQCILYGCDSEGGCTEEISVKNGQPCDDTNACTVKDQCMEGMCMGISKNCDDFKECTTDTCNPNIGCIFSDMQDGFPCGDSDDLCLVVNECQSGDCTLEARDCDDSNVCTKDSCESDWGCINNDVPMDGMAVCDDGNACTVDDQCTGGTCMGMTVRDCDDDNICTFDSCDSETGCTFTSVQDGLTCHTGDACILKAICSSGVCDMVERDCDDSNPCTKDTCDSQLGCVNDAIVFNGQSCNDDNLCTSEDICINSICTGIPSHEQCDDANECTSDTCHPKDGCSHDSGRLNGFQCSGEDPCTIGDICTEGVCVEGDQIDCDDHMHCTTDTCDPWSGQCLSEPVDCDDNDVCTTDYCNVEDGECVNDSTRDCDDNDLCTIEYCHPENGCVYENIICEDSNDCTEDSCNPLIGCVFDTRVLLGAPCNDGSICTENDCCTEGGICEGHDLSCDDANECTVDECNEYKGCESFANLANGFSCDDESVLTSNDTCSDGLCFGTDIPPDGDTGNPNVIITVIVVVIVASCIFCVLFFAGFFQRRVAKKKVCKTRPSNYAKPRTNAHGAVLDNRGNVVCVPVQPQNRAGGTTGSAPIVGTTPMTPSSSGLPVGSSYGTYNQAYKRNLNNVELNI